MEKNELKTQYETAIELNQKIIITAQMAQKNLYDMCVLLKEMRDDKLYKELGYQNFEDYCENEIGFKGRVQIVGKRVGMIGTKVGVESTDRQVDDRHLPRVGVRFLTVDRD